MSQSYLNPSRILRGINRRRRKAIRKLKLLPAALLKEITTPWRIIRLHKYEISKHRLEIFRTDAALYDVVDDLVAFTELPINAVEARLMRYPRYHFASEFRWYAPTTYEELTWFYRISEGYLFGNAIHPYWELLDFLDPEAGSVLDYGGGAGNNAIGLANRGFQVDYLEIGSIQEQFMRFRLARHDLDNIRIIAPYVDGKFDAIRGITGPYSAIILQDVLEHIPNYHITLRHLIECLKSGGHIIENSPFDAAASDIAIHLRASVPFGEAMMDMTQIEKHVWRKS